MADVFYDAAWGPVRLFMSNATTSGGRELVIHSPTAGDKHQVQDRGQVPRRTRVDLLFDQMDGDDQSPKQRFDAFRALVDKGDPQLFTHPLLGTFLARIGDFDHTFNEDSVISGTCEFVPVDAIAAVTPAGPGTSPVAGDGAVTAAASELQTQMSDVGMSTDMIGVATAAIDTWNTLPGSITRKVLSDVGTITDMVGEEIDRLGLADDISLWSSYRAFILLGDTVRSAGDAATSEVTALFTLRVERTISLRTLVSRVYGGFEADDRYRQALELNDIATPAWIPAGTELRLPQPNTDPRRL